ncbi:mitochondrial import inner membrane translocase subunit Tim13 isoform X2 [Elaeis guineensis]|uniref:Mitochondrial import inner membrane translocase subunit n=2 Tax=Elaeis guineensis var. tenera TaxID=51953 RepID=A0A6I9RZ05_ELAGV|nr:mitochondrial import inner membrane translocase subunit Tim13 isoform X2 [Elaeis guineensis]
MDPFSSPAPSNGSSGPSTEALMDQVKAQLAQAYAEEFLETVRSKCFSKCITKPGTGLSGSESSCISRCVERYIEATRIIGQALFNSPRKSSSRLHVTLGFDERLLLGLTDCSGCPLPTAIASR